MNNPVFGKPIKPGGQRGIVLVESLIAILIFSIGILGIVGLQAAMVKNTADAKYRSEASFVAQKRLAEIRLAIGNGNQAGLDSVANYMENDADITVQTKLPNGRRTTLRNDPRCGVVDPFSFCVLVIWQLPGGDLHSTLAVTRINPNPI